MYLVFRQNTSGCIWLCVLVTAYTRCFPEACQDRVWHQVGHQDRPSPWALGIATCWGRTGTSVHCGGSGSSSKWETRARHSPKMFRQGNGDRKTASACVMVTWEGRQCNSKCAPLPLPYPLLDTLSMMQCGLGYHSFSCPGCVSSQFLEQPQTLCCCGGESRKALTVLSTQCSAQMWNTLTLSQTKPAQ